MLRVLLTAAVAAASLAWALSGASPVWATPSLPYFTALPESGSTELQVPRLEPIAAPLPDGQVLIAGGRFARSAELFNPATDTFTALPASGNTELQTARTEAVAVPLANGQVLIASGQSAELFNPATDTFTALPASGNTEPQTLRGGAVAAPLSDGQVLIAGGAGSVRKVSPYGCRARNCSTPPPTPSPRCPPQATPSCRYLATRL